MATQESFQEKLKNYAKSNNCPSNRSDVNLWLRHAVNEIAVNEIAVNEITVNETSSSKDVSAQSSPTKSMKKWVNEYITNNPRQDRESQQRFRTIVENHLEDQKLKGNLKWDSDNKKWVEQEGFEYPNIESYSLSL